MIDVVPIHTPLKSANDAPAVFPPLVERCHPLEPLAVAVCQPASEVALNGVIEAKAANLIAPICVGNRVAIEAIAAQHHIDISGLTIIDKPDDEAAAQY